MCACVYVCPFFPFVRSPIHQRTGNGRKGEESGEREEIQDLVFYSYAVGHVWIWKGAFNLFFYTEPKKP